MNKFAMQSLADIDQFDKSILELVQQDNLQSHAVIGEKVGLSTSSVRRRLERLREKGLIYKDVSLLNRDLVGVTLIVTVTFARENPDVFRQFEKRIESLPEVGQCYHISGEKDYLLIVGVPNLQYYEEWGIKHLMSHADIKRYDTIVCFSCKKFDTQLPV